MKKILLVLMFLISSAVAKENNTQDHSKIIGDNIHVEVYTFIGDFLDKHNSDALKRNKLLSDEAVKKNLENEEKIHTDPTNTDKPHSADMVEGEISGVLTLLLLKDPKLLEISIYGTDGVGIVSSDLDKKDEYLKKHSNCRKANKKNNKATKKAFPNRIKELQYGFLTKAVLSGPNFYKYKDNKKTYHEYILPVYKIDSGFYGIKPSAQAPSVLVGYVSYLIEA